jgi:hypothetical protein
MIHCVAYKDGFFLPDCQAAYVGIQLTKKDTTCCEVLR